MVGAGGGHRPTGVPPPVRCGLASPANRLPLLLYVECPLEHREGCGLGLAAPALWLHRLLDAKRWPDEQRLLRLRGLVTMVVALGAHVLLVHFCLCVQPSPARGIRREMPPCSPPRPILPLNPSCPGRSSALDAEAVQEFREWPGIVIETVAG